MLELIPGKNIYVNKDFVKNVRKHTTITAIARVLMDEVFTKEAMITCSLLGKPARSKGSANITVRTALDSLGVETIISK